MTYIASGGWSLLILVPMLIAAIATRPNGKGRHRIPKHRTQGAWLLPLLAAEDPSAAGG